MDSDMVWVGLDVGLRRTHLCIVDHEGEAVHEVDCETSLPALAGALSKFPADRIGLIAVEAGSETHIVRELQGAGFSVAMFEARKASCFLAVRRNKTDASDARGLADLARVGRNTVSQVYVKSPECERMRSQIALRKRLVILRVAAEGTLRSRFALHGTAYRRDRRDGAVRRQVQDFIAKVKVSENADLSADLLPLADVCENLKSCVKSIDQRLSQFAHADDVCRLLMEVPGVGPICALSFTSAIEDPARFRRASDVAAYLGLVPRRYQSGQVSRTLGITKTGSKLTRTHLVIAATSFGHYAPECRLKTWHQAVKNRCGSRRANVALARKLSSVLLAMWKRRQHFQLDPTTALTGRPSEA
jgi:transposase